MSGTDAYVAKQSRPTQDGALAQDLERRRQEMIEQFTIRSVTCDVCGTHHGLESDSFITVQGNICVGMDGGVVGNNFGPEGHLFRFSVYCRSAECLSKLIERAAPNLKVVLNKGTLR